MKENIVYIYLKADSTSSESLQKHKCFLRQSSNQPGPANPKPPKHLRVEIQSRTRSTWSASNMSFSLFDTFGQICPHIHEYFIFIISQIHFLNAT